MEPIVIQQLKSMIAKTWPLSDSLIKGFVGPDPTIISNIEKYHLVNIMGDEIRVPSPDELMGYKSIDVKGTAWEKILIEFNNYKEEIRMRQPDIISSEIITYASHRVGVSRQFGEIMYNALNEGEVTISETGVIYGNCEDYRKFVTEFEQMIERVDSTSPAAQPIQEKINYIATQTNFQRGIVESIWYELTTALSPKYVQSSITYMKYFLAQSSLHKEWTKTVKQDIWGRLIVAGKPTLILVKEEGIVQYVKLIPPLKFTSSFFDAIKNLETGIYKFFGQKTEWWEPLAWIDALKFAVDLLDLDKDLVIHLTEYMRGLEKTESKFIQ